MTTETSNKQDPASTSSLGASVPADSNAKSSWWNVTSMVGGAPITPPTDAIAASTPSLYAPATPMTAVGLEKAMLNTQHEQTQQTGLDAENSQVAKEHNRCEKWKSKVLQSNSLVKFMAQELQKSGCPFKPEHFKCLPCDVTRAGGFAPAYGIVLCQNQFVDKTHMADVMVHELVHAYDYCTVKIDSDKKEHFACTEIRAAALSGECRMTQEFLRGNFGFAKHFQECVRRRAIMSLKQSPIWQGDQVAEDAVRSVWSKCFNDLAPFDEIY
ncbi:hypothetical protein BASA50_008995 [Batrachochytrium salamandrivorans]|uniref:Mitochondrial inner membrane protease ATP23 n=1 Tax=Batrachochytrium salamandrivorans TaxID=1357716 RepID=A0ABQ8F2I6_9FUNG|nr:hypothetical protein BASA62_000059 [Batrachochytrium salamandrivorans]KAH6573061.1 hypothetical protein BASA60_006229 [Batrachochytrium salamandrivorans]KAH6578427.1 hypothetical protein BASA61_000184 [Batrachochytrium salamandrivorans]KAH6590995.1 hypothetical protein BASA50_008995 [Batrachochytrium salamandrivorans]KAH9268595.1 hypothetical protein BASA84_000202 [Batrachochytrium salamandrivorans]